MSERGGGKIRYLRSQSMRKGKTDVGVDRWLVGGNQISSTTHNHRNTDFGRRQREFFSSLIGLQSPKMWLVRGLVKFVLAVV